ncbi:TPA: SIR2 family protein, partial [Yersinia enterocolitica]|nr:SIR2 family protein [Yersinia enterocolitica]
MDNKCIYQGGEILDEKDYLSHISSLCQLDNVGVLLGAGASVGCGGKTMKDVWTSFNDEYPEFVSSLLEDYNLLIKNAVDENTVNIEILIDDVSKFLSVSKTRKKQNEVDFLSSVLRALYRKVTEAALLVDDDFGNQNQGENDKFNSHRELIEKLISNRLPGQAAPALFTTNYDLAIEWSAEEIGVQLINGFTGIHTRQFVPQNFDLAFRNVNAKGEARFGHYHAYLYKLHGSLTWLQNKDMNVREVSSNQAFSQYISKIMKEEAIEDEQYLIYPGANKYHHTIGFVYGEMFRRFSEFLSKPQTALFINGFGFGDYHINRII